MKTKRLLITALLCVVCAMFGLFAVACNNNEPDEPEATTYIVTFDVQGHGTAPSKLLNVEPGSKITEPTAPTAEGYVFDGWYKENTCTNKWNFASDTVEKDTTLYAKWDEQTYTVKFDVQGKGTAPADVTGVKANAKIKEPTAPTADGFAIEGWYKEKTCETKWDFEKDTVTANTTLYANWVETFTVTFDAQGHGTAPAALEDVAAGSNIDEPAKLSETGFVFEGWYKEATCETKWNFATDTVEDDTTLYAYWKQIYTVSGDPNADAVTIPVSDHAYFTVSVAGQYYISIEHEGNGAAGGQDSEEEAEERDDTFLIDGVERYKQQELMVYLTVGRHTITCTGAAFDAEVKLNDIDLPFTETCTYMSANTEFVVTGTGIEDGVKTGMSTVRVGEIGAAYTNLRTISFDGTYYVLQEDYYGTLRDNYYRLKVTETQGKINSIELAHKTDAAAEWGTPETLTRLPNATDVVVNLTATSETNDVSAAVQDSFDYVYFNVSTIKDKWLLFTNLEEGTTFYWVAVDDGRTGAVNGSITVTNNEPVMLHSESYDYIAVSPAQGSTVSFTLQLTEAPAGLSADNPIVIENSVTVMENALGGAEYFFTYNVETAGEYVICVFKDVWSTIYYNIYYKVNNTEYGYDGNDWLGNVSKDNPYAELTLSQGVCSIVVTTGDYDNNFTINIEPALGHAATTGKFKATVEDKTYLFDINAEENKVSLTLTVGGNDYTLADNAELTVNEGVYSFSTVAVEGVAEAATYTFKVHKNGTLYVTAPSEFKAAIGPFELAVGKYTADLGYDGRATLTISGDVENGYTADYVAPGIGVNEKGKTLVFASGAYTFEYYDSYWNQDITVKLTLNSDGTLHGLGISSPENEVDFTFSSGDSEEPANLEPGTYSGTDENGGKFTLIITQYGPIWEVEYIMDGDSNGSHLELTYNENGSYSFNYTWNNEKYEVTFTVTQGANGIVLHVVDGTINFDATAGGSEEPTTPEGDIYIATVDSVTHVILIADGKATYAVGGEVLANEATITSGMSSTFTYEKDGTTYNVIYMPAFDGIEVSVFAEGNSDEPTVAFTAKLYDPDAEELTAPALESGVYGAQSNESVYVLDITVDGDNVTVDFSIDDTAVSESPLTVYDDFDHYEFVYIQNETNYNVSFTVVEGNYGGIELEVTIKQGENLVAEFIAATRGR